MVLPAAIEEGKSIKKRYAVFNKVLRPASTALDFPPCPRAWLLRRTAAWPS
jgi:hypothetical protein